MIPDEFCDYNHVIFLACTVKEGQIPPSPNIPMAIIKCQHQWLKWLEDEEVDFVRVFRSI